MRRAFVALVPTAVHGRRNGAEAKEVRWAAVRWAAGAAAAGLWRASDDVARKSGEVEEKKREEGGCFMPNTSNWYSVYKKWWHYSTSKRFCKFALLHQSGS
jgi:hypothetical protein